MATRSNTKTAKDPSGKYQLGLIDTAAAAANKLIDADVTDTMYCQGVKKIFYGGTYIKGSSTNGKLQLFVDGVLRGETATSTTDGEQITNTLTVPVYASYYTKAVITGTATGASINYPFTGEAPASVA